MNTKKFFLLLLVQNIVLAVLFALFLFMYKAKITNDIIVTIVSFVYFIPTMVSMFLLLSGWLVNQEVRNITIGVNKNASIYERLGKLFFAETMITGIAKKDFIDNQKNRISKVLGTPISNVYELYGELNILHGEYLKQESEDSKNKEPLGFKSIK